MDNAAGRDEDFAVFVVARSARLMHIAHMLCGDREQAQDIAQTALEKAYVKWDRIHLDDPFAYVRQVVVNECRMGWRRMSRGELPLAGGEVDLGGRASYIDDPAVMVTQRVDLLAALVALTERERTVVVLRYVESLTEADTARIVGNPGRHRHTTQLRQGTSQRNLERRGNRTLAGADMYQHGQPRALRVPRPEHADLALLCHVRHRRRTGSPVNRLPGRHRGADTAQFGVGELRASALRATLAARWATAQIHGFYQVTQSVIR